jgi:hypothetical protein
MRRPQHNSLSASPLLQDVPILSFWGEGVMGPDAAGAPAEHDGRFADGGGALTVVLGRVPGACVAPFAGARRRVGWEECAAAAAAAAALG